MVDAASREGGGAVPVHESAAIPLVRGGLRDADGKSNSA